MNEKMILKIPYIIERTSTGEQGYDIYTRLLKDRIVFLDGEIDDYNADLVVAQLLYLESQDQEKDISLYINSPGGSVTAGLAIYDTMQYLKASIQTICLGQAFSMAALILTGGTPGKRFALPSSRMLIHQPWGGVQGQAKDISIHAREIVRLKKIIIEYFARHTNKSEDSIAKDLERDFYMSSSEAVEYHLVDQILTRSKDGQNKIQ